MDLIVSILDSCTKPTRMGIADIIPPASVNRKYTTHKEKHRHTDTHGQRRLQTKYKARDQDRSQDGQQGRLEVEREIAASYGCADQRQIRQAAAC